MKTTILFFLIILCSTTHCQTIQKTISIYGGPTISTFLISANSDNFKSKIGFTAGLSFDQYFNQNYSIIGKLGFERKGASLGEFVRTSEDGKVLGKFTSELNYDYLTAAVLYNMSTGEKTKFYLNIGPTFNYLLRAISELKMIGGSMSSTNEDFTEYKKRYEMGISLGVGVMIPVQDKIDLDLGIFCNYGLSNTRQDDNFVERNISYCLQVGAKYKL
jgi:hypothetical protein